MQVMLLHKTSAAWEAGAIPSPELVKKVGKMIGELAEKGILRAGAGLRASSRGVRLNFSDGHRTITPGPFVGANELTAGFLIVQVHSLDEAMEWSSRLAAILGDVEIDIRPLTEPWDIGLGARPEGLETIRYMAAYKATPQFEAGIPLTSVQKAQVRKLHDDMRQAGVLQSTTEFKPSSQAMRFGYADGEQVVMDGPFTESKELIAGFVTIEVPTIRAALDYVPRYMSVVGCRELDVRPLQEE